MTTLQLNKTGIRTSFCCRTDHNIYVDDADLNIGMLGRWYNLYLKYHLEKNHRNGGTLHSNALYHPLVYTAALYMAQAWPQFCHETSLGFATNQQ